MRRRAVVAGVAAQLALSVAGDANAAFGQWRVSYGGVTNWENLAVSGTAFIKLAFGDFDGDGKTDVFKRDVGGRWMVSHGGATSWNPLAISRTPFEELAFADLDGDGRTDVFKQSGGRWWASYGGTSNWTPLALSNTPVHELRFGDFNGDGADDVFKQQDGRWWVSYSGTTSWDGLARSNTPVEELGFGDFDGDGFTDVFKQQDGRWWVAYRARSNWKPLAASRTPIEKLRFGDFDGDGRTDVFKQQDGRWWMSRSGSRSWTALAASNTPVDELAVGDFDGDGQDDVFGCHGRVECHFANPPWHEVLKRFLDKLVAEFKDSARTSGVRCHAELDLDTKALGAGCTTPVAWRDMKVAESGLEFVPAKQAGLEQAWVDLKHGDEEATVWFFRRTSGDGDRFFVIAPKTSMKQPVPDDLRMEAVRRIVELRYGKSAG